MRRTITILTVLAAFPWSAHAQWQFNGVPIATATGIQLYSVIIPDLAGGAIIAWQDARSGSNDIYVQRVNSAGIPLWTAGGVALCTAANGQLLPQLAPDGEGGAIVTWMDFRGGGTSDVYAQRVNSTGSPKWTTNGVPVCTAPLSVYDVTINSDGVFGAIITWADARSGAGLDIYAQRVDSEGLPKWTVNGVALCVTANNQYAPILTTDQAHGAIVAWVDERTGTDDIYAQRVNEFGVATWIADGEKISTAVSDQLDPTIVSDGASGAIIAWRDRRAGNFDIYAQRVDATGVSQWMGNGVALCTAPGDQWSPTIASDNVGGAIIAWPDSRAGGPTEDIYVQRVDQSGTSLWTAGGVVICAAEGHQAYQTIVSDGASGAIVTWYDERWGASDIFAQRVDASGAPLWSSNGVWICTAASYQFYPEIATDGASGAIITWFDDRADDDLYDVYAHRVDASGGVSAVSGSRAPSLIVSDVYPNPFAGTAWIDIQALTRSTVSIEVFDVAGRTVRAMSLADAVDTRRVEFNGRDDVGRPLPSGVYFCRVRAVGETVTRKMVIAR
jgi:hypothetical protein